MQARSEDRFGLLSLFSAEAPNHQEGVSVAGAGFGVVAGERDLSAAERHSYTSLMAADQLLADLSRCNSRTTTLAGDASQASFAGLGGGQHPTDFSALATLGADFSALGHLGDDIASTLQAATQGDRAQEGGGHSFHSDTSILATNRETSMAVFEAEGAESARAREVARKKVVEADSVREERKKRQEDVRRKWLIAKHKVDDKKINDPLSAPLPIYDFPVSPESAKKEEKRTIGDHSVPPALSGVSFRPKILEPSLVDSTLPPPSKRESSPAVPKWLKFAPDAMAPSHRPTVVGTRRIFSYNSAQSAAAVAGAASSRDDVDPEELVFDSSFESGNLLSATRVYRDESSGGSGTRICGEPIPPMVVAREYDLQMHPDVHCRGHTQWFYFSVANLRPEVAGTTVRFNITNFAKQDSLYLDGMQPLIFSTHAARTAGVGWKRAGNVVCYAPNTNEVHEQQIADMKAAGLGCTEDDDNESVDSGSGGEDDEAPVIINNNNNNNNGAASSSSTNKANSSSSGGSSSSAAALADDATAAALLKAATPAARGCTHTMSFDLEFEHADDVVYLAYSHPYTYTELQVFLEKLQKDPVRAATFTRKKLCESIAGNRCDLLTVTAPPKALDRSSSTRRAASSSHHHHHHNHHSGGLPDLDGSWAASPEKQKRLVVLSARVHPGESNSSWIMHGILEFLTSVHPAAMVLRREFVFKVVPMLNPDGVINGNYRCSLSGQDLNRQWHAPCRERHPSIAALKNLIAAYQSRDPKSVSLYCDLHGHSRAKGIFLYGILSDADRQEERRLRRRLERAEQAQRDQQAMQAAMQSTAAGGGGGGNNKPLMKRSSESWRRRVKLSRFADPRAFPTVLEKRSTGMFTKRKTSFKLGRGKENTARAVVCRELRVQRSYTLEASFCGGVGGEWRSSQFTSFDLVDFGRQWCLALVDFYDLNDDVVTMLKLTKLAAAAEQKSGRFTSKRDDQTQQRRASGPNRRASRDTTLSASEASSSFRRSSRDSTAEASTKDASGGTVAAAAAASASGFMRPTLASTSQSSSRNSNDTTGSIIPSTSKPPSFRGARPSPLVRGGANSFESASPKTSQSCDDNNAQPTRATAPAADGKVSGHRRAKAFTTAAPAPPAETDGDVPWHPPTSAPGKLLSDPAAALPGVAAAASVGRATSDLLRDVSPEAVPALTELLLLPEGSLERLLAETERPATLVAGPEHADEIELSSDEEDARGAGAGGVPPPWAPAAAAVAAAAAAAASRGADGANDDDAPDPMTSSQVSLAALVPPQQALSGPQPPSIFDAATGASTPQQQQLPQLSPIVKQQSAEPLITPASVAVVARSPQLASSSGAGAPAPPSSEPTRRARSRSKQARP